MFNFNKYSSYIFDRDGVINAKPKFPNRYILKPEELRIISKTTEQIVALQELGKTIFVATNQQCVGKELISESDLKFIHDEINASLIRIHGKPVIFYSCIHLKKSQCNCRKPKPGLLEAILKDTGKKKSEFLFVGDAESDYRAAKSIGMDFKYINEFHKLDIG